MTLHDRPRDGSAAFRGPCSQKLCLFVALPLALVFLALGCAPGTEAGSKGPAEGEKLYAAQCASCHGRQGDRIPAAPLHSKGFLDSRGDATLVTAIGEGKGVMLAFGVGRGGPLTDGQIQQVLAYLNARVGRSTPSLLAGLGQTIYNRTCVRCHGEKGDRVPIAPLPSKGFLDSKSDTELIAAVTQGKGVMPPQGRNQGGNLSDEEIQAVVSYLRYRVEALTADRARRGRDLYTDSCIGCHGERGDRVKNVALASGDFLHSLGDGNIITAINQGKGTMPGFGKEKVGSFGVEDTAAVLTYLKAWAGLSATSALAGPVAQGQGKDLFVKNCAPCHGEAGDKVPGLTLLSSQYLQSRTDAVLVQSIARGNPRGMPAWGQSARGPLTDTQIGSILDYLKAAAKAAAPTVAPAPPPAAPPKLPEAAGDAALAARGKDLYAQSCAICHGQNRNALPTCKLGDAAWLQQQGDEALMTSIANGKGAMPAWGKAKGGALSDADIQVIVAYLKQAAGS